MKANLISLLSRAAAASVEAREASGLVCARGPEVVPAVEAELGLSRRALADRAGCARTHLSRVAHGSVPLGMPLAERLYGLVCDGAKAKGAK